MIINYSVKNFYSVGGAGASVNFAVDGNAPKTNLYVDNGEVAGRVSLIESVIGPNASGKTRLLQGLAFIDYMITSSYQSDPSSPIPFETHLNAQKVNSEVSVRFVVSKRIFEYLFVFNKQQIIKEELKEFSKSAERVTAKTVSSRKWDNDKGQYDYSDKELGILSAKELRRNASMVASAMQKDSPSELAKLISDYWSECVVVHNLWVAGNREDSDVGDKLLKSKLKQLLDANNEGMRERVKQILSKYDIGFDDFYENIVKLPNDTSYSIYGISHKFDNSNFVVLVELESSGTKRLISTLSSIVGALLVENGGIAIIDEIDAFLHPDIVEALVDLFIQPETNPNRSQLLFSTHNHRLLESLDKQQVVLTEKNNNGDTESWRLDEMTGIRSTDNFYEKYITGAYGARPKIES